MPVFLVNGSPKAFVAAFFQAPPNTKAVTGSVAASARAIAPGKRASAAPPSKPPSDLMSARRPRPRLSTSAVRKRSHSASVDRFGSSRIRFTLSASLAAAARQPLRRSDARQGEDSKSDQDRGGGRYCRVGGRLHAGPDFHGNRLADAAEHENGDEKFVRRMHECQNGADDDAGRDDRQRDADDRPQRRRTVDDGGALQVAVGAAQAGAGID